MSLSVYPKYINVIYKMKWKSSTYGGVVSEYARYVKNKFAGYKSCCIVYDGYMNGLSTKDHEHLGRGVMSADVDVHEHLDVTMIQKYFLRNPKNKQQLTLVLP